MPYGGFGEELYQLYHKPAVFSHEELICVIAKVVNFWTFKIILNQVSYLYTVYKELVIALNKGHQEIQPFKFDLLIKHILANLKKKYKL